MAIVLTEVPKHHSSKASLNCIFCFHGNQLRVFVANHEFVEMPSSCSA